MKTTVLNRQNLLDVALKEYGSPLAVFDVALQNGLSVTDDLLNGPVLEIPVSEYADADILNFYQSKRIKPATAAQLIMKNANPVGIGSMQIEALTNTFKVA